MTIIHTYLLVYIVFNYHSCFGSFDDKFLTGLKETGVEYMNAELPNIQIPDVQGHKGETKYDLTNIRMTFFRVNANSVTVSNEHDNKIKFQASKIRAAMKLDYRVQTKLSFLPLVYSGKVVAKTKDANFRQDVQQKDNDEFWSVKEWCTADLGNVKITFTGGSKLIDAFLNRFLKDKVATVLKDEVNKLLCEETTKVILDRANIAAARQAVEHLQTG